MSQAGESLRIDSLASITAPVERKFGLSRRDRMRWEGALESSLYMPPIKLIGGPEPIVSYQGSNPIDAIALRREDSEHGLGPE